MKTLTLFISLFISISSIAQNGINYKAVIKDSNGNVVANQTIDLKFTIIQGITNVYQETHATTTDGNGIAIVNIGEETPILGTFSAIDWDSDTHSLKTEIDLEQDGSFVDMGTAEFKTVPYALSSADNAWETSGANISRGSGKVSIGSATASTAKTEINHDSSIFSPQILLYENGTDFARLNFGGTSSNSIWALAASVFDDPNGSRFNFYNSDFGDIMSLRGNGNVGIHRSNPEVPFHVAVNKRVLFGNSMSGEGNKMFWDPLRIAFRVGYVSASSATNWDESNLGFHSFATGNSTLASGEGSVAMGLFNEATGYASTALGGPNSSTGNFTVAMGEANDANAYASVSLGTFNIGGGNETTWVATDPLFIIGNGTDGGNRSNALSVLKNGTITAPSLTNALIDTAGDKALVTKEYVDSNYGSSNSKNITIPASAFNPSSHTATFIISSGTRAHCTNSNANLFAPLALPTGAIVTQISAYTFDNDPTNNLDFSVGFAYNLGGQTPSLIFAMSTDNSSSGLQVLTYSNSIIISENNQYFIRIRPSIGNSWNGSDLSIAQVKISYTE